MHSRTNFIFIDVAWAMAHTPAKLSKDRSKFVLLTFLLAAIFDDERIKGFREKGK